jgi:hypothetical protein
MYFGLSSYKIITTVSHTKNIKKFIVYYINIKVVKAQITMKTQQEPFQPSTPIHC